MANPFIRFCGFFIVSLVGVIGLIQTVANDFIISFILALIFGVMGVLTDDAV